MKTLLGVFCLLGLSAIALAEEPPWKEIEAAAQAGDFARLESWVKKAGLTSGTAAHTLTAAARCGDRAMIDQLLALGLSPNVTNLQGVSAMLHVAQNGQTEMVQFLLQRGTKADTIAFCEAADCKGHTPLMGAACKQDVRMARMLLEAGANPRAADDAAIKTADENGDVELFLLLKQFGGQEAPPQHSARLAESVPASKGAESATPFAALGLTELLPGKAPVGMLATSKSKGRLSVIADDSNVAVADLLTAQLSAEPLLELVERQELDRILSEQKLTRQFATDAANYGQVARLLRADALLLINGRQVAGTKVVETRLIRVNPGLVLDTVYTPIPIAQPTQWAERIGSRVAGLAAKLIRHDAIALSLLNIRASVSSSAGRGLDRTLAVLLSDRLTHQPHFVVLERAAMERLTSENTGEFWTGSYLVDGTLEPALDGSGAFVLAVRFQPAGRGETLAFTTVGRRADPAAAVDDLLNRINGRLAQAAPPARRDLAGEAQRYFEEAKWALAANQSAVAQSAAEAAHALGLKSIDLARLRVTAAMRTLREFRTRREPGSPDVIESDSRGTRLRDLHDSDSLTSASCLDFAIHGVTVWRDTLQSELPSGQPEELRKWLDLGLETADDALLALITIDRAAEQVRQADRLETLRELLWESLEQASARSAQLPTVADIGNKISEKQACAARLLFPRTSRFIPAARSLLARHFKKDDALTRARIRSNLILNWSSAHVVVRLDHYSSGSTSLRLSPGDEASHHLSNELRSSPAPEDRYFAALLAMWTASQHREATATDLQRLRTCLWDMRELLAQGGEVFSVYWERFAALDKLTGVPFFDLKRSFSPDGHRMWDRHTPEHAEFRRQLYLGLCAFAQRPDPQFQRILAQDQFTPEQQAEVLAAQARLGSPASSPSASSQGGMVVRPRVAPATAASTPAPQPPVNGAPSLRVLRLWTPFDLGLNIPPEFEADFGSMTWAEGRLWLHGSTFNRGGQPDQHFIFAIDPATMRTETFPIPQRAATLNARFLVTTTNLVFAVRDFLTVFDRAGDRWDIYAEIKPANLKPPVLVGDSVYLIVKESPGNALIRLDLNRRATEVLASTRRRPAASPFDDPGLEIKSLTSNEAGELVVVAETFDHPVPQIERESHAWSPTQRTWREIHPRKLKSAVPMNPQSVRAEFGRVGTIHRSGTTLTLRLSREEAPATEIPLIFLRQAADRLPESRYGPQNIWPAYCNSFAVGVTLVPASGSGFWVVPQNELDDYLQQNPAATRPAASARN